MPKNKITILGVIVAALHLAGPANAEEPFMSVIGRTSQPIGHYEFCKIHPADCAVRSKGESRVHLTAGLWNQLVDVNNRTNASLQPATDQELFGRPEVWSYADRYGDCEDYVLLKRRALIGKGWPAGALLITVVEQSNGDGHAVLTVRTDRGDLILDNLQPRIVLWHQSGYRFVKRQSEFNSGQWMAIVDRHQGLVGSLTR